MTHMEKCELNIGAHMHQNVPIDGSDTKGETEPQTWMYSDLEVYQMTHPTSLKAHTTYFIPPHTFGLFLLLPATTGPQALSIITANVENTHGRRDPAKVVSGEYF